MAAPKDPVTDFECALDTLCTLNDVPARQDFIKALQAYVDHRIAVHIANIQPPYIVSDTLSDADYEALLKPYSPYEVFLVDTPYHGPMKVYGGPQRPTCAVCGSLLVQGLCSNDAAHYQ